MNFKIFGYGIVIERIEEFKPEPVRLRQLSVDEILAKAKNYIGTRYKFCETCGTEKEILEDIAVTSYDTSSGDPDSWKMVHYCPDCGTFVYFKLRKDLYFSNYNVWLVDRLIISFSAYTEQE